MFIYSNILKISAFIVIHVLFLNGYSQDFSLERSFYACLTSEESSKLKKAVNPLDPINFKIEHNSSGRLYRSDSLDLIDKLKSIPTRLHVQKELAPMKTREEDGSLELSNSKKLTKVAGLTVFKSPVAHFGTVVNSMSVTLSDSGITALNGVCSNKDIHDKKTSSAEEGLNTIETISRVEFFPNPTNGLIFIKGEINQGVFVELVLSNNQGALIDQKKLYAYPSFTTSLDLSGLEKGVYTLKVGNKFMHVVKQ